MQIGKSRLEAHIAVEIKAQNNWSNFNKNLIGNKTLDNIIEDKDLMRDLGIVNNDYL